ncbi:UbiA family prenyltransferase [Actibacterium lipolyticum]|uniref:Prenyltransferase n=1 Tax=Actibacterium lipolyticum TaxID=1524263 RepID=A0A238KSK5_9RHOB|nr:UbiA family prenyltransferase [Actibacterium lipolyticum]SMX45677.1 prenyltransferase [Actibacterium lipolyticum]
MSVLRRLWTYQGERFPLIQTIPLLAVFSAASINVSAFMGERPLPGIGSYVIGLVLGLVIFFQMRAADEWKDHDLDCRYRPERPIPRGLVSLRLILGIALTLIPVAALVAWAKTPALLWLLLGVWGWLALMTAEFGVAKWLKARPLIYLVSHMAIMPLIDLLLTGVEWAGTARPAPALWMFLVLSLVNGCVLEIGRKTWAPENERDGVETYSGLWGAKAASMVWLGCVALAAILLIAVGRATGPFFPTSVIALFGLAMCCACALQFRRQPTPKGQKRIDAMSGIWVLSCYAAAGFIPLLSGAGL